MGKEKGNAKEKVRIRKEGLKEEGRKGKQENEIKKDVKKEEERKKGARRGKGERRRT